MITIPTLSEIMSELGGAAPILSSDFAIATGLRCDAHCFPRSSDMTRAPRSVWSRTAAHYKNGSSDAKAVYAYNTSQEEGAWTFTEDPSVGIIPMIVAPSADKIKFGLACHDGKQVLTCDGDVVFYPKRRAADSLSADIIKKIKAMKPAFGQVQSIRPSELSQTGADRDIPIQNMVYHFDDHYYAHVKRPYNQHEFTGNTFSDGTFNDQHAPDGYVFLLEPIEGKFVTSGSNVFVTPGSNVRVVDPAILCTSVVAAGAFDHSGDFNHFYNAMRLKDMGDIDDISKFSIGEFLNTNLRQDLKILAVDIGMKPNNISTQGIDAEACGLYQTKKFVPGFKRGAMVKITCEGKSGVVQAVDKQNKLATINVGGKSLKYRFEDLVLED